MGNLAAGVVGPGKNLQTIWANYQKTLGDSIKEPTEEELHAKKLATFMQFEDLSDFQSSVN